MTSPSSFAGNSQIKLTGDDLPATEDQLFNLNTFPLLNVTNGLQVIGDKKILQDLLLLLVTKSIPEDTRALKAAHTMNDWKSIEQIAHRMKSGALYCGTEKMQYACQYLERYHKAGYKSALPALYQQLMEVLAETRAYLTKPLIQSI